MPKPAVERLNAPAWGGGAPFYEDWYLKANLPDQDASVWIRYTLRVPDDQPAEGTVWGIVDLAGERTAARRSTTGDALELAGDPFRFATPFGDLESEACGGRLAGLGWELTWDATPYAFWALPSWGYELPDAMSKTVTPNPDLAVRGHVELGERTLELDGAPGQQGHVWGRKHADAWAWAHSNAADGPVWEVAAVRAQLAGRATPAVATVSLRHEGRTLAFRNPIANRVRFDADGLEVTARTLRHRVRARVHADALGRVTYTDPDGERAFCHNTKRAASRLVLEERSWTGWREVGRWTDKDTTAYEIGLREPVDGVPVVLDEGSA